MSKKVIGPALPPHLQHLLESRTSDGDSPKSPRSPPPSRIPDSSVQDDEDDGVLVLNVSEDELCPEGQGGQKQVGSEPSSSEDEDCFGPPPPPGFDPAPPKVIGPALPPPDLRSEPDQSDEDDVVGPMPPTQEPGAGSSYAQRLLDERAIRMKRKLAGEEDDAPSRVASRETWMLELPPDRSSEFGLGPRQFRARAKLDLGDRSVWTETPVDREHRANDPQQSEATSTVDLKSETEMIAVVERDRAMQKLTDKHNKKKKRKESLVDLHQKKLKKKQKKEEEDGKVKERRPFDRNLDLQANRFDEAQKKAILRKAQLLDDRFSRGESKFL